MLFMTILTAGLKTRLYESFSASST
jgi:hypothetical protein